MQKQTTYEKAIALKFPEQIVIAIAKEPSGKCNPITIGWTMITSHEPPMMAVSIGLTRHSLEVFRQAKEFVIAMPSQKQAEETMLFGTKSGRDCDKFAEAGTSLQPAEKIDCVLMADAVANFELRKAGEMVTGDHMIFVGRVVCSHVNERKLNRLYTASSDFKLLGLPRA